RTQMNTGTETRFDASPGMRLCESPGRSTPRNRKASSPGLELLSSICVHLCASVVPFLFSPLAMPQPYAHFCQPLRQRLDVLLGDDEGRRPEPGLDEGASRGPFDEAVRNLGRSDMQHELAAQLERQHVRPGQQQP